MVQPLLDFAAELEARDARVAAALAAVERLQAEVDEIRTHAAAVSGFLAALPASLAAHAEDEERAESERLTAQAQLRDAEAQKESPLRDLAVQRAKDAILDADRRADRAREHQAALTLEGAEHAAEGSRIEERARALHGRLRDIEPPRAGLAGTIAWASQARGALLVEHSGLVREREGVVREASELLGSVLGDPLATTSVAGLRDRLARALP